MTRFEYKTASAHLSMNDPITGWIMSFRSQELRQGHGTGLMRLMVEHADENGITMLLTVNAYGKNRDIPNNEQLEEFYARFGFRRLSGTSDQFPQMMRVPARGKLLT